MKTPTSLFLGLILSVLAIATITPLPGLAADDETTAEEKPAIDPNENLPTTTEEARGRARWLHELVHGALQVMHRDFFGDGDEDLNLPSQSLEDVFEALAESWQVEIRWLGVNATKAVDHEPDDEFEEKAAKALAAGDLEYEAVERGKFRFVGAIQIRNECLKCHVPNRTSLEDRVGGLAISIPLKKPASAAATKSEAPAAAKTVTATSPQ